MTMFRLGFSALALTTMVFGASVPETNLSGNYVEARTADVYTGPCFANSEAQLVGNLAVFAWHINKGSWQGVDVDNLSVVAAVRANSTLGDTTSSAYPVKASLIVDEKASPEQRFALQSFAKRMGGDLLQDVVRVDALPIDFTIDNNNIHGAKVSLTAGTLAAIQTRALRAGDHVCSNEETWYQPLTKLDHAMPAYAIAHRFDGRKEGLTTSWSSPDKRSAFVGTFHLTE
jgi:hypothetical protein